MKPYFQDDAVTIYHGDCREILPRLRPDEGVFCDLVLTDPPYGIHKAGWDSEFSTEWMEPAAVLTDCMAVMPGVWNLPECPRNIGPLTYQWTLVAHLTNGMTRGVIGFGNWIPCLVYTAEGVSAYKQDGDIKDFVVGVDEMPKHPSPKPYRVMRWLVSRLPGDTILDPFMGSGTTLRAAKDLGRKAIGIEIEERYCEMAAKRMAQGVLIGSIPSKGTE